MYICIYIYIYCYYYYCHHYCYYMSLGDKTSLHVISISSDKQQLSHNIGVLSQQLTTSTVLRGASWAL